MSKARGQSANRSTTRQSKLGRIINNSKGVRLVVTPFIDPSTNRLRFSKTRTFVQQVGKKTIVHQETYNI